MNALIPHAQDARPVVQGPQLSCVYTLFNQEVLAAGTIDSPIVQTQGLSELYLQLSNGLGTCTATVYGSYDNFQTAQDILILGVILLTQTSGSNINRIVLSGALAVTANNTVWYAIQDPPPYLKVTLSSPSGMGQGSNVNGLTAKLYGMPE